MPRLSVKWITLALAINKYHLFLNTRRPRDTSSFGLYLRVLAEEQGSWYTTVLFAAGVHSAAGENAVIPALPASEFLRDVTALPSSLRYEFTAAAWRVTDHPPPSSSLPSRAWPKILQQRLPLLADEPGNNLSFDFHGVPQGSPRPMWREWVPRITAQSKLLLVP